MARQRKPRRKMTREQRRKAIYVLPNLFTTASLFAGFYCAVSAIDGNYLHASIGRVCLVGLRRSRRPRGPGHQHHQPLWRGIRLPGRPGGLWRGPGDHALCLGPGAPGPPGIYRRVSLRGLRRSAPGPFQRGPADDAKPHKHFTGLPIPAAACMLASTVMMWTQLSLPMPFNAYVALGLMFVLGFLMVSNIQYLSFKSMGVAKLRSFNGVVASLLVFVLVAPAAFPDGLSPNGPIRCRRSARRSTT